MTDTNFNWGLVGHGNIQKYLQTAILNMRPSHAYVFYGPSKVGKTFLAKNIAQTVLCDEYRKMGGLDAATKVNPAELPCGRCDSCRQFTKGMHPDFYTVEREVNEKTGKKKSVIAVGQIRDLLEKVSQRAFLNSYKVVIIPEAQTLSQEASNCLLKTLEEPAPRTIIFLIAPNKDLLLPTIQSRSQLFKFLPVPSDAVYEYLVGQGANRDEARELARLSRGRPTIARQFLKDEAKFAEYKNNIQGLLKVVVNRPLERLKTIEKMFVEDKGGPARNACGEALAGGDVALKNLDGLAGLIRDAMLAKLGRPDLMTNYFVSGELADLGQRAPSGWFCGFLRRIENARMMIQGNVNPRLVMESLFLE